MNLTNTKKYDRPTHSSEGIPHDNTYSHTYNLKSGHESQKAARHHDRLDDYQLQSDLYY